MATLRKAIEWIANNDDVDLGSDEGGYLISVYMAADLFDRQPAEIARAVRIERQGLGWRLGRKARSV